MFHIKSILFNTLFLSLLFNVPAFTGEKPYNLSHTAWQSTEPYILPDDSPIRTQLDHIFENRLVLRSTTTLKAAGFQNVKKRPYTGVIVASHPLLPDVLIKLYTDKQSYPKNLPEWKTWLRRIKGAELVRKYIEEKQIEHYFAVPKKWIYFLPTVQKAAPGVYPKFSVLVVEKMPIVSKQENEKIWTSEHVTEPFLKSFFKLITTIGLWDCAKTDNAPFMEDGRVAFIDTDDYAYWPVEYEKLDYHLALPLRAVWWKLRSKAHTVTKWKSE